MQSHTLTLVTLALALLLFLGIITPPTPVDAASSTLSGILDYPTQTGESPMRDSYFEVLKKCGLFEVLTCIAAKGTTDLNGFFSVEIAGGCDCWIRAFTKVPNVVDVHCAEEPSAPCQPPLGQSRTLHYDFSSVKIKDGDSFDYDKRILPSSSLEAEGARIADTILTSWLFVQSQTGVEIPSVSVQFPCETVCPTGVYFDPRTKGDIYIRPDQDAKTIVHGYGQYVMWYHTTALSEDELSSLMERSLSHSGEVIHLTF